MNIRLIHSLVRRHLARGLAIAATAALTAFCGSVASAQSGLVGHLSNGQTRSATATSLPAGTRIVPASSVRTAADLRSDRLEPGAISQAVGNFAGDVSAANADSIEQVSFGCPNCSQPACNGGCNSCGNTGYGIAGYGSSGYSGSMACGVPCNPYWYANVEALYYERRGVANRSLIRNTPLGDDNFELMPRITIGSLPNCVRGWEITAAGGAIWDTNLRATDPNGGLQSLLIAGPAPFDATFLDPFSDANIQTASHSSKYWSAEINRTVVGWDVVKVLYGLRYVNIEDRFVYASHKDIFNSNADVSSRTHNDMLGVQGGLDLVYPLARNLYTDFRGRAGLMINLADSEVRLRNQGQIILRSFSDDTKIAGLFEVGGGLRFQMGEMLTIRGGFELLYITDYASGIGQIDQVVTNAFGSGTDMTDVWYYGATVGAELKF